MQMKIKTTITYSEIEKALLTSFREALEMVLAENPDLADQVEQGK